MEGFTNNPTLLGLIAIAISAAGTILGVVLNYKRDQRAANKSDLQDAYDRMDKLEKKIDERDDIIEEQAEIIRKLRNDLAARDLTITNQKDELGKLRSRVTKLEKRLKAKS